jgi:antitoxin ParD1/3/4
MNVSLTNEMEQWVQQKVGSGLYSSASEVVREAIRALHAKEMRNQSKFLGLRDAIQQGIHAMDKQGGVEWSETLSESVKKMGRKRRRE